MRDHLAAGATDGQAPHGEDEIYYVASGQGVLSIDGVDHPAEAGAVFFVRAQVDHFFHSVTEALDVLVVFARSPSSADDPMMRSFTSAETTQDRNPDRTSGTPSWRRRP